MTKQFSPKRRRSERGQSVVEFTITFLVLVLLLSVVLDFGRMYFASIAVREAAEEGALYGSLGNLTTSAIETRVEESSTNPVNLNTATVTSQISPSGACATGKTLIVTVTYNFEFLMPLIQPLVRAVTGSNFLPITGRAASTILQCP
ncbi:MAG: pilus assembly protein [Anaerolineales bacterium]|nr:pilus assembly protein [Anaerolineales bacterium]